MVALFLQVHHYDMQLPDFKSSLYGVGEHIQRLSISFLITYITIDTARKKISQRLNKLNEIE